MIPIRPLHAIVAAFVLLAGALAGCATRGPGRMRIAVVGRDTARDAGDADFGLDTDRTVSELEERLVGALLAAPRVDPVGATGPRGERDPLIDTLHDAPSEAAALAIAARRGLTHVLLVEVSAGERGPRAELRALAVATGALVWRASWSAESGGLGAVVAPWMRRLLTSTGFLRGLPPVAEGPARRAVSDLTWRGYGDLADGDEGAAEEALSEALRRDPEAIRALQGAASLRLRRAAEEALSEVLQWDLGAIPAPQGGASLRLRQELEEEALEAAERALAVRPEVVSSQSFTAEVARDVGDARVSAAEALHDAAKAALAATPPRESKAQTLAAESEATRRRAVEAYERAYLLAEGPRPLLAARAAMTLAELQAERPGLAAAALERALARLSVSPCGLAADGRVRPCDRGEVLAARFPNRDLIAALGRLSVARESRQRSSGGVEDSSSPRVWDVKDCAGATPLHAAAALGDRAEIDRLLAAGAPVDPRDDHGWTPLHRAARAGSAEAVARLLAAGADPAARDLRGRTPLMVAVVFEALDALRALAPRSPLEARTRGSETALHLAAAVGSVPAIRLLLDRGAVVDALSWGGQTPLVIAATRGHVEAITTLLAAGADPEAVDATGLTALELVARQGRPEGLRALVAAGAVVDAVDDLEQTALSYAIIAGRSDNVRELLALGASPSRRGPERRTPLHLAASRGEVAITRALAAASAPLDAQDDDGRTALMAAALAGRREAVVALLDAGADPELRDGDGRTALELAVVARRAGVVEALRPPPKSPKPNEGITSDPSCDLLLLGARTGTSIEVARALIAGGCSPATQDADGRDAAMVATDSRRPRLALFLAERTPDLGARDASGATLLHHAARADDLQLVAWLVERRPRLAEARDGAGWLPLHAAAAGGASASLDALVAAGTDPRALTTAGADAAHVAAAFGHTSLVQRLLGERRRAADLELAAALGDVRRVSAIGRAHPERLSAPGVTGLTPLIVATINGQYDVVNALLELGADLDVPAAADAVAPDLAGVTAIAVADRAGAQDLVDLLVAFGADEPLHVEIESARMAAMPLTLPSFRFMEEREALAAVVDAARDGEPVVPVGAEPLGVQIRERTSSLDVLVRGEVLEHGGEAGPDDGWDAVVRRCVDGRDHASAARELTDQLVLRGLDLPPDAPALGLVHHNLGRIDTYLARYDAAERELDAADDALASVPAVRAAVTVARADLRAITGRHADAARLYDEALSIWDADERYTPPAWLGHVRSALANLLTEMARYDEAREAFAALVAARAGGDPDALAIARNNQAVLFDLLGDHAAATSGYERARELLSEEVGAVPRAVIANNLAFARLRGGDARAAARLASAAVEHLEVPPWEGRPQYARGRALITWARAEVALGDLARARELLTRAERELRAVHGDVHGVVADVVRRRAALDLLEGRTDEAVEHLVEALAIARLADSPEHAWRVEDDLARALVAAGRPRAAAAMDKLAVNTLQALRARVSGVGATLARAYLAERTAPYRRLAALLIDAGRVMEAQLVLDMLKDEEAYAFTRATRSSGGAPLMGKERVAADAVQSVGRAADLASRAALKKYLRGFKRAVAAALLAVDEDDEQAAASIEARLDQLSLDRLDDLRAFLEDPSVASEHVAFLQLFLTDDKVRILLTLPEQETRPFESKVPVRRVYRLISRLRDQLQDERSDPRAAARELYDALLRPVRSALDEAGVQTLMVWLDGALRYAPLAALHDDDGWLVERFRVAIYTPVTHAALKDRRSGDWRVDAFGMSQGASGFDPLPGVPAELDAIVARAGVPDDPGAMKGAIWLDGAFTAAALTEALEDGGVQAVHVASHYAFDPEGDEGSFLLLGDKSHMSLEAIRAIARKGRLGLMTFSACNTAVGLGALAGAESSNDPLGLEIEGLGNVVQRELATAVLATLWPVVDTSTVAFMRELYGALQEDPSLSKAAAVQRAQLRLLRGEVDDGHPRSWVHPRFWAPFVLMGNWR